MSHVSQGTAKICKKKWAIPEYCSNLIWINSTWLRKLWLFGKNRHIHWCWAKVVLPVTFPIHIRKLELFSQFYLLIKMIYITETKPCKVPWMLLLYILFHICKTHHVWQACGHWSAYKATLNSAQHVYPNHRNNVIHSDHSCWDNLENTVGPP